MSFNVRVATAPDGANHWQHRREMLFGTIESFMPDLLGLQEVQPTSQNEMTQRLNQYEIIAASTGTQFNPTPIMVRRNRFKIERTGAFWLSPTPDQWESKGWDAAHPRVVTWAELRDLEHSRGGDSARLFFVNTHWDHRGEQSRVESAKLLRERLPGLIGDAPVIITGDFNCPDGSEPHATMMSDKHQPRLIDSYRELHPQISADDFTFHGFRGENEKHFRVDWILHSDALRTAACAIDRTNMNGRYPSDHFPVTAVLEWVK
jgi:endonuclease/exonuclease/phosphatase family metal-dependent hydrolase